MAKKLIALLLCMATAISYAAEKRQLAVGVFSAQNKRPHQEDRYYHEQACGKGFFGVYDGHGGDKVAEFLKENLHTYFREKPGSVEEKMKSAFNHADNHDFVRNNQKVGSTANVVFVEKDTIHFANTGDSRAVLEENGKIVFATKDHKPEREDEAKRIKSANGLVFFYAKAWRVNGALAVSRAIGDCYIDKNVIIAEPEYTEMPLTKKNQFVIIASDGLWDKITNEEAVCKLREYYTYNKNLHNAAMYLAGLAIAKGSTDNITVMIVDLLS